MNRCIVMLWAWCTFLGTLQAQTFEVLPLGVRGGVLDGEDSAYLLRNVAANHYVVLDAGNVLSGLRRAASGVGARNAYKFSKKVRQTAARNDRTVAGHVFQNRIKGYLISHAHADHIAGLVNGSQVDAPGGLKPIYGLQATLTDIQNHYFNGAAWPNFTNAGAGFQLNYYQYAPIAPSAPGGGNQHWLALANTTLEAAAWPLHHGGVTSTAFFIRNQGGQPNNDYFIYFGDVGPDPAAGPTYLANVWQFINAQPAANLKAIFIEVSWPDPGYVGGGNACPAAAPPAAAAAGCEQEPVTPKGGLCQPDAARPAAGGGAGQNACVVPVAQLFGHLSPYHLLQELNNLAANQLNNLNVYITHRKPSLYPNWTDAQIDARILQQITTRKAYYGGKFANTNFVVPEANELLRF